LTNRFPSIFLRCSGLLLLLALTGGCFDGDRLAQDENLKDNRTQVIALYRAILEREADPEGLELYSGILMRGEHNLDWIRETLRHSDEGVRVRKGIDGQYRSFRHLFRVVSVILGILVVLKILLLFIRNKRSVSS